MAYKNQPGILWIALVYSFFDEEILQKFDDTLSGLTIYAITKKIIPLDYTAV